MYDIENNIPRTRTIREDFPFDELEIDQSFEVPADKSVSVHQIMKNTNKKSKIFGRGKLFRSEATQTDGRRIWRVK